MTAGDWLDKLRLSFPLLNEANCRPTSLADNDYNCIAWAAEDTERWWWPDSQGQTYWPATIPRNESMESFRRAFALLGYVDPTDDTVESGRQKIAIFATAGTTPTHAARQLPDGWWTSKLGRQIDIAHELRAIEGPVYGSMAVVLARAVGST